MSRTPNAENATEQMTVEIHQVRFDFDRDDARFEVARDIRCGMIGGDDLTRGLFSEVYEAAGYETVESDDVNAAAELAWRRWNAGSGVESNRFIAAKMRSVGVGDVFIVTDAAGERRALMAAPIGFERVSAFSTIASMMN